MALHNPQGQPIRGVPVVERGYKQGEAEHALPHSADIPNLCEDLQ